MAGDVAGSAVLSVGADGSGFEATLTRLEQRAQQFERTAVQSAGRAGAAVGGVGTGAAQGAERMDAASKRFTSSIEREIAALTLSRAEYRKWEAQTRGVSESVYGPLVARLDAARAAHAASIPAIAGQADAMRGAGAAARQLSVALRAIPGLEGIASPLRGVGAGLRAVAGLANPVVVGLGAIAVAGVGLAVVFGKGASEMAEFRKALVLTGSASGATADQLNAMSAALGNSIGDRGKAAETLAALAATGRVAARDLQQLAEAAILLEREGGPAVKETAKAFAELGKNPTEGALKLNESTRFLTVATLEQIRALEQQGKAAEAARVAQVAYATEVGARARELSASLGFLETAWRGAGKAAKSFWDAALNVGREDSLAQQLAKVNAQLGEFENTAGLRARGGKRVSTQETEAGVLRDARNTINRSLLNQFNAGAAKAAAAGLTEEYEKARNANDRWTQTALTNSEKLSKALIEYRRNLATVNEGRSSAGMSPISAEQVRKEEAAIRASFKETAKAVKEQKDVYGELAKQIADTTARSQQEADQAAKLTDVQRLRLSIYARMATDLASLTAAQKIGLAAMLDEAEAAEKVNLARASEAKFLREAADAKARYLSEIDRAIAAQEKDTETLREQIIEMAAGKDALEQYRLAKLADAEAELLRKAAMESGIDGDSDAAERYRKQAAALRELIALRRQMGLLGAGKEADEAAEKSAKALRDAFERSYNEISRSLTDALMKGGRGFVDYLKGLFRNLVLRPILEPFVRPIAGALAGVTGAANAAGVEQGAFGSGQATTLFNAGKSIYEGFASGFSGVGNAAAGAYSYGAAYSGQAYGTAFGSQQSAMLAAQDAGLGSAAGGGAGAFGTAASYAAGAAAGVYGGRAISGGYSAIGGGSGNTAVNVGTIIGAYWGPIGSAIGGAIGGLVNRVFGRKAPEVEGRSIEGTITGSNFAGSAITSILEKGGTFRSDRRSQETQAITGDLDKALDEGAKSLSALAAKYGAALGLPAEQLAGVTADIKVKITDSAEDNAKAITEALKQYADALLGTFALDVEPLRRSGETVAQTIERVGGALLTINGTLDLLGVQALAASIDGGKAATAIADLFGGAGNFAQAGANYYQKFYSEAERVDRATASLTETFAELGLTLPASRDAFRAAVDEASQALDTSAGQQTFAKLIALADAFDIVATASENVTKAAKEQAAAMGDAIARTLPKFLSPEQAAGAAYGRVSASLQGVGLGFSVEQLLGASKADILAFATSFVNLASNSQEAKLAVVDAADALADLKDNATKAAEVIVKAFEEAAADLLRRQQSITSGVDSVAADFLAPAELQTYRASRVQEILDAAGIETTVAGILGSTKATVRELFNAVGIDGKEAILAALPLWQALNDSITATSRAVAAYRGGDLAGAIEQARLGSLSPTARIARLRGTEAALFGQLSTAADPVAVAQRLTGVITQRLGEEARLTTAAKDLRLESLRTELAAAKSIKDVITGIPQFTSSLRFGDLSPLSRRNQLGEAQRLFDSTLLRSQGGDKNALGNLQGNAQALIQEAISAYGSGAQAAAIFDRVTASLDQFASVIGPGLDPQIAALETQIKTLDRIEETSGAMLTALLSIDAALGGSASSGDRAIGAADSELLTSVATSGNEAITSALVNGSGAQATQMAALTAEIVALKGQLATIAANTLPIGAGVAVNREGFTQVISLFQAAQAIQQAMLTEAQVGAAPT